MPIVSTDSNGKLDVPASFLQRRHLPTDVNYWITEREGELILHPRLPDARKIYIEATTGCNLHCSTCIRNIWSDPIASMKQVTFDRILESLPRLPELERVNFTGLGEPLSHPRILEMIEAVRARGLAVSLGTNGVLLKPKIAAELVRLGVDRVVVSVDGVSPEMYENVRGTELEQVLKNLHGLNEAKKRLKSLTPALGIEFVALKSNVHELSSLSKLAHSLNAAARTGEQCTSVHRGYDP